MGTSERDRSERLLTALVSDEGLRQRWLDDREGVLAEFGLSEEELKTTADAPPWEMGAGIKMPWPPETYDGSMLLRVSPTRIQHAERSHIEITIHGVNLSEDAEVALKRGPELIYGTEIKPPEVRGSNSLTAHFNVTAPGFYDVVVGTRRKWSRMKRAVYAT